MFFTAAPVQNCLVGRQWGLQFSLWCSDKSIKHVLWTESLLLIYCSPDHIGKSSDLDLLPALSSDLNLLPASSNSSFYRHWQGRLFYGGNDARCVIEILGGKEKIA